MALALVSALAAASPAAATVVEGDEGINAVCNSRYFYSIPSYSSTHMPHPDARFKDGPGPGTMTVEVKKSGTVSFTGTVSGGATIGGIVAKTQVSVSASATTSATITIGHTVTKDIPSGKFLRAEYGSWGYTVDWRYYYEAPSCARTLKGSGTAKVPTTEVGWKFTTLSS